MNVLAEIVARKKLEVAERKQAMALETLRGRLGEAPVARSLRAQLSARGGPVRVISEVKRRSPSKGALNDTLDPVKMASAYEAGGAAAISVLTDGPGFGGSLEDLRAVRAKARVPVLRKDFIVDRWQLYEARANGADAVLLIVAALTPKQLEELRLEARELGMDALVECHDEAEVEVALGAKSELVGVNNRSLKTFEVTLQTSLRLFPLIPREVVAVAESGVHGPSEVRALREVGAANFLVGEALVKAADPSELLRALGAVG